MHDLDRTQMETESYELAGEALEAGAALEGPLPEIQELELASELLEVASEQELDRFLGDVIRNVSRAAGQFVRSDVGRALTSTLRGAARQALPAVGGAIGGWISPGSGAAAGRRLGQQAGSLLGLELEGLSPQDQEFEAARQFVRFAAKTAQNALSAPPTAPAQRVAGAAARAAAQQYLAGSSLGPQNGADASGRWVRRGDVVVLLGT